MLSSADIHAILNVAADMVDALPQRMFTREEVVRYLRVLPGEIASILLEAELARAMSIQEPERQVKPS